MNWTAALVEEESLMMMVRMMMMMVNLVEEESLPARKSRTNSWGMRRVSWTDPRSWILDPRS